MPSHTSISETPMAQPFQESTQEAMDISIVFQREDIHSYSGYRVEGQQCAQKFDTINKLKMFISWVRTKIKQPRNISSDHFLPLAYEEINVFRQADMIRMGSEPTATPGPTTPMTPLTSHTSGSK